MTFSSLFFLILFFPSFALAVTLTGNVDNDFGDALCTDDPNGQNIALPGTFPVGTISGFDLRQVCIHYNVTTDELTVGLGTFEDASEDPIIFGDADGDGDAGGTGAALDAEGGEDLADMANSEFVSVIFDFDGDFNSTPEMVAGVSAEREAPEGFRVAEVALPDLGIDFGFLDDYYGDLIDEAFESSLFDSPSAEVPHLEFTITAFSLTAPFGQLDLRDPDEEVTLLIKAGSVADTIIGEEEIELVFPIGSFFDLDGDDTPDASDDDDDGDGLTDLEEQDLDEFDTDGDGFIDEDEAEDSGLDADNDGDLDTDDGIIYPDADGDGIPDYQETDSDDDGLLDSEETDLGTNPVDGDSDGDGIADGVEAENGGDPLDPNDVVDPDISGGNQDETVQVQGSGGGCSLNVEQFRYHFDGQGLVNQTTHRTLKKGIFSGALGLSYADKPLELGRVGTGARLDSLVDSSFAMNLVGAYGITDMITVGMNFPFFPNLTIEDIGTSSSRSTAAIGDVALLAKMRFWDKEGNLPMGAAFIPFFTLPTGDGGKYVGNSSVTGGFNIAYDLLFKDNLFLGNMGFRFREEEQLLNLTVGQELLYGLGYSRPIKEEWDLNVLSEINGSLTLTGSRENRIPLEILAGVKKGFMDGTWSVMVGGGAGLTVGYGTPDFRIVSGLNYQGELWKKKSPQEKAFVEERKDEPRHSYESYVRLEGGQIVTLKPIYFETANWTLKDESLPVVKGVADLMLSEPHLRHVVIKGHTDARGDDNYNLLLSQKRAQTVLDKLVENGVARNRLTAEGWGEQQPIDDNDTDEGMSRNRRTEFIIVEIQKQKVSEKKTLSPKSDFPDE